MGLEYSKGDTDENHVSGETWQETREPVKRGVRGRSKVRKGPWTKD